MSCQPAPVESKPLDVVETDHADRGAILILVLVMGVIGTLFILPILYYTNTVLRAGSVPTDKAEAVELAEGGTWIALSRQGDLYDDCVGGELTSSLDEVTTTCTVLATERLRDPVDVPFGVATIEADQQAPSPLGAASYLNPNTAADPAAWLVGPDYTAEPTAGSVWLPPLPERLGSSGGSRDNLIASGTAEDGYTTCRVFFPGSFDTPITISEPTYFTSGNYTFTQPITLRSGADVVVGTGSELGCATDQTAIAFANSPSPLNMSGYGGTFVLGDDARIVIDDTVGGAPIRFMMNQRYVTSFEQSAAPSQSISIITVNGDDDVNLTDPLVVPGVVNVPASTIGVDGNPAATTSGYVPSNVTSKPYPPGAPIITGTTVLQRGSAPNRGRITVSFTEPESNSARITSYTVTDGESGRSCTTAAPTLPDTSIQLTCTIDGLTHGQEPVVSVTATSAVGTSAPSLSVAGEQIDLDGPNPIGGAAVPDAPPNAVLTNYSDGLGISWDTPADGGSPIVGYRVTVTDPITSQVFGCEAWWDETSCVVPLGSGLVDGVAYDIAIFAQQRDGDPGSIFESLPTEVLAHAFVLGGGPAPVQNVVPFVPIVIPVIDFATVGADDVNVKISGYIAAPQGHVHVGAVSTSTTDVSLLGGLLAGAIVIDGAVPDLLDVRFDNPIAQKRIRLVSTTNTRFKAESVAVVQVNESGSLAINSWVVQ